MTAPPKAVPIVPGDLLYCPNAGAVGRVVWVGRWLGHPYGRPVARVRIDDETVEVVQLTKRWGAQL
jgi:hypothetical protein